MKIGTQADLRKHLESEFGISVSREAISRQVKAKNYRIHFTPGGKIVIEKTAKALADSGFGNSNNKKPNVKSTPKPKKEDTTVLPTVLDVPENEPEPILTQEDIDSSPLKETDDRGKIEKYLAFQKYEKERIANEKAKKELTNFNDTKDAVFNFLRPFRDDVLEIGVRIAAIAYQSKSKHKAQKAIDDEVDRIFKSRVGGNYKFDEDLKKKISQILTMSLQRQ